MRGARVLGREELALLDYGIARDGRVLILHSPDDAIICSVDVAIQLL
jgi:hypothetical protein